MESQLNTVEVNITRTPAGLEIQGFGTGVILAKNQVWNGLRVFASLTEATTAGVIVNSTLYRMIEAYFSTTPRPSRVKVWSFVSAVAWGAQLKVISVPPVGTAVTVAIVLNTGTVRTGTYTVAIGNTAVDIAAGLHASIDPQAGVASAYVVATDVLAISADTATEKLRIQSMHECIEYLDTEGDVGYTAQLAALAVADSDFYGVMVESTSKVNIEFVAAWVQANRRIYFAVCHDSREYNVVLGAGTTGLSLKTSGYDRTDFRVKRFSEKRADAAFAGVILSQTWDSGTAPVWSFRTLPGIDYDTWTSTQLANLRLNNASTYSREHGAPITYDGKTPSGTFGDFVVFLDWLDTRIREAVFSLLIAEVRLAFTSDDIGKARDKVFGVLVLARSRKGISPDFPMPCTAPNPTTIPAEDRAAGILGGAGIQFQCTYAGGINKIRVNGSVTL